MNNYRPKPEQRIIRQLSRVALLLLLGLAQSSLLPDIANYRVDLVLIAVVSWTLLRGLNGGLRWAVYGGVALGLMTPALLGAHVLALTLVSLTIAATTEDFPRTMFLLAVCVAAGSAIESVVLGVSMQLGGHPIRWLYLPLTVILPEALLNVVLAIPIYALLRRLNHTDDRRGWA